MRGLNFDLTISDVLQLWHVETSATTMATICAANRLATASCPLLTTCSVQGRRRRCPTAPTASPTIPSSAPRTQSAWPATEDLPRQVGGGHQVMPAADVKLNKPLKVFTINKRFQRSWNHILIKCIRCQTWSHDFDLFLL